MQPPVCMSSAGLRAQVACLLQDLVGHYGEPLVIHGVNVRGRIFNFYLILGVWEVSQSTGNCLEIDLDEFSAREVAYSCIFDYFHDFTF